MPTQKSLLLLLGIVFFPSIPPKIARVIHNYQLLFSYILQALYISLPEAFFDFLNISDSFFSILSLIFPCRCSCFCENFTSMQVFITTPMTSCKMLTSSKMSHSLVTDFTDGQKECLWQFMAKVFGCSARTWVKTQDFFPIMFGAQSYVWPLQLLKRRLILMRMSLITCTMVPPLIFSNR